MRQVKITHNKTKKEFRVPSAEDWRMVAEYLVGKIAPGDIIALSGPLGAGKTTFVQAFAKELGIKKTPQSPTFALMRSYDVNPPRKSIARLLHVDAYRIDDERDLLPLDLDSELADGETILVIEWPEHVQDWLLKRPGVTNIAFQTQ